jgi:Holliday junction resolvase RusA-like endonuclease
MTWKKFSGENLSVDLISEVEKTIEREYELGNKLKVWRKAIAAACQNLVSEEHSLLLGPVRVEVEFYLPRPASVTIKKRALPIVPPDLDKLLRGLLDGIGQSEVIWGDDSQVVQIEAVKLYADDTEPGATVTIYAL